ncbi:MAG: response regulator, partial [Pyrinomonadaceae bacterium]
MVSEEPINILMVDDSATNLLALESILHAPDINLVSASSGYDALRYLLHNEVAVILLDVYMPGIDGLETAELIRGREKSRDIPIIFLTADTTGGRHLPRGYSLGAVDFIVKPIEPDILRSKVQVFVELFKKTREIRRQAQLLHEKNLQLENANLARLSMLIELGQELAAEHDPARVLEKFCHAARRIVEAEAAAIGVFDGPKQKLRYFTCSYSNDETRQGNGGPQVAPAALKWVVSERRPLRLNETDALLRVGARTTNLVHSFLGAPLLSSEGVCGWAY